MRQKLIQHLLVLILLVPLLFINIKNSHDWGDDFAQYIHQSQNIINGISQNNTGFIFNENYFIGPVAYPSGFPLLLAPVIKLFGIDITSLNIYLSLFLVLSCFMTFLFLRKYTSYLTALITTLIIAYNPMMIDFKTEILSDLPFTFFSLLTLYLITKQENVWRTILIGALLAFTVHIRSIGYLLVFVYLITRLLSISKTDGYKSLILGLTTFLILFMGIKFLFPYNSNYPSLFEADNFWLNANNHISYNFDKLYMFFRFYEIKNFFYIGVIASSSLIAFSFIGLIKFIKTEKLSPITLYVIGYILIVISFKYGDAGLRFLFPILVFIFLFAIIGVKTTLNSLEIKAKWLPVFCGVLILYSYSEEIEKITANTKTICEGPYKPESIKMFEYINENIKPNDVVEFDKPRALALYTHVQSVALNPYQENLNIKEEVKKFKISYILTSDVLTDNEIKSFLRTDTSFCKMICSINEFQLYKIN